MLQLAGANPGPTVRLAWSPKPFAPAVARGRAVPAVERLGQSTAGVAALGAVPLLLGAALGAGTAWVGFSTGSRESGILSILGYLVGSLGALAALGGTLGALLWIAGVGTAAGEIERMRQEMPPPGVQRAAAPTVDVSTAIEDLEYGQ